MRLHPPSLERVLRVHALLSGAAGGLLLLRTPHSAYLATTPEVAWTILHIIGALFLVSAAFSYAVAKSPDRFSLRALLAGQWVALLVLIAKYHAVFDYQLPVGPLALFAISVLLLTFWQLNYRDTGAAPLEQRYRLGLRQAASQEERHRLARDLHDSVKQQVFAIQTAAATAQQAADPAESIALIRETARDMMTELDAMLDQLQAAPLTMSGLAGALRKLAETTRLRTGASLTVTIGDLPADEDVPPGAAQTLLRIAQEALSNTARHARASQVEVSLGGSDPLLLRVNDNGAGFDSGSDANGMGLRNIRARALELGGAATIVSSPGQGTRLTVETPARRAAPSRRQLAVTAVLTVCLLLLSAGPNPLHPLLLNALRGTMAIFIVLHFVGARKVEA